MARFKNTFLYVLGLILRLPRTRRTPLKSLRTFASEETYRPDRKTRCHLSPCNKSQRKSTRYIYTILYYKDYYYNTINKERAHTKTHFHAHVINNTNNQQNVTNIFFCQTDVNTCVASNSLSKKERPKLITESWRGTRAGARCKEMAPCVCLNQRPRI